MPNKKKQSKNYQKMNTELAEILEWFESDRVSLDGAVDKYEQALKLIKEIEKYLKTAENKVRKITRKFST